MRLSAIALTALAALSLTIAQVDAAHKRHHHMHQSAGSNSPNGTAGGPTTLSGTGSSKFGGNSPGTAGKN
jgi:hypothetical protein